MAIRIRKEVYSFDPTDETLDWYRRAVAALRQRPLEDPTSWWWMAAVHGNPGFPAPANSAGFWDRCQHQSWYFLPWHRGYITAFEAVVAKAVEDLGGPSDWALPYWNYSLAANPDARMLPPAFRNQFLADGSGNALFAPRAADVSGDVGLRDVDVSLDALSENDFTSPAGFQTGLGGPRTGFSHFSAAGGELESVPHNVLHVRIGGWMGAPNTAAFDPIFWLHHCNIDRLWEEWRATDTGHTNPADSDWLRGVTFQLHGADGQPWAFAPEDLQDTTGVLHGYRYDTLPGPLVVAGAGVIEMAGLDIEPELAGASDAPLTLEGDLTRTRVLMQTEGLRSSFTEGVLPTPIKVYLRLENVTGTGVPADYDVLIDLVDDDLPPLEVGVLSTFGIANSSDPDSDHGGQGLTQVYDISAATERLKLTSETAPLLQVSFRKVTQRPVTETVPIGIEGFEFLVAEEARIQVGRIGIYFE